MYQPVHHSSLSLSRRLHAVRVLVVATLLVGCGEIAEPPPGGPDAGASVDEPDATPMPNPTPDAGVDPNDPDADVPDPTPDAGVPDAMPAECGEGETGTNCESCLPGYQAGANGTCVFDLPPTSGMTLWLDASESSTIGIATGRVQEWKDRRSPVVVTKLTAPATSARPAWVSNGMNDRGVVRFQGDDDLTLSSFTGLNAADYTMLVVYSPAGNISDSLMRLTHLEFGTAFQLDRLNQARDYRVVHRSPPGSSGGDSVQARFSSATTDKLLVLRRYTSVNFDYMRLQGNDGGDLEGADDVNGTLTNPNLSGSLTLHLGDASTNGDFAEVIVYNRLLSGAELQEVEDYLAAKWNLQ
jgi:hypothetical protein